jgi:hypothetical protein
MDGQHQILHTAWGQRREPSKRQAYSSIAQPTRSQQRPATKQLVTLATDDPAYFATSPKNEYLIAANAFGLSAVDCKQITLSAIDAAFCDNETKARLRQSLEGNNTGCNEKVTAACDLAE